MPDHNFRDRALVRGVIRLTLVVMENLPAWEIPGEFAGAKAMNGRLLAGTREVYEGDQDAAGRQAALGRIKQICLQVITDADEFPDRRLDPIFPAFEIGYPGVHRQAAKAGAATEDFDGGGGAIHGRNLPTLAGEPQGVAAGAAGQIEGPAGRQSGCGLDQKGHGGRGEIFFRALTGAIALFPARNLHVS